LKHYNEIGTLNLGQEVISYSVIRSARRKRTMTLQIQTRSSVVILAPLRTSFKALREFLQREKAWIQKQLVNFHQLQQQEQNSQRKLMTGEQIPYLGINYPLSITQTELAENQCQLEHGEFNIKAKINIHDSEELRYQIIKRQLLHWYQAEARRHVSNRLPLWCECLNVSPQKWRITNALKRWGSCSSHNIIAINWRVIFGPIALLDYIIVHELCHIVHKNHSRDFWELVASVMPDYKERKTTLRKQEVFFLTLLN
jgi:predicted metal-dependent hydrolase